MDNKEFSDLNEEGKADFAKAYREKYSEKNFPDAAKKILFGKDITKMMSDIPVYGVENGEGVEYEFKNENRPRTDIGDEKFDAIPNKMPPLDGLEAQGSLFVHEPTGLSAHTQEQLHEKIRQSQWNDPEMTGQISVNDVISHSPDKIFPPSDLEQKYSSSMDIQNEKTEGESLQEYHAKHFNKEALDKRYSDIDAASKLISFTIENSQWIADVHNYCQQNNIQPQDLIDCYSRHHTQPSKE